MIALNEMYFGKTNRLLAIEDLLDKFKDKYKDTNPNNMTHFREMLQDDILKKIATYIKNEFKFNEVYVTLYKDKLENAYTVPFPVNISKKDQIFNSIDDKEVDKATFKHSVIITNSGFRFDTKKFPINFLVCISVPMITNKRITSSELMSVLLHEIGHNFSKIIIDQKNFSGRADETFADEFASMYGYNKEFSSVMRKLHTTAISGNKSPLIKIPVVNMIYGLAKISKAIVSASVNPNAHPGVKKRLETQIEMMESELKNNADILSKEIKDQLKENIEECKKLNKAFFNSKNDNMYGKMIKWYWNTLEPKIISNKNADIFARKGTDPDRLNTRINDMYKKKGYFK